MDQPVQAQPNQEQSNPWFWEKDGRCNYCVKDLRTLVPGDHIYSLPSNFLSRKLIHGIVYSVPNKKHVKNNSIDYFRRKCMIFQASTQRGLFLAPLDSFGVRTIRKARYGFKSSVFDRNCHGRYLQLPLHWQQILDNIDYLMQGSILNEKKRNLQKLGNISHSVVFYCMTGFEDEAGDMKAVLSYLERRLPRREKREKREKKDNCNNAPHVSVPTAAPTPAPAPAGPGPLALAIKNADNYIINDLRQLSAFDHICRRFEGNTLQQWTGFHHGIVYCMPSETELMRMTNEEILAQTEVFEMTRDGILKTTLKKFQVDETYTIYRVRYGVPTHVECLNFFGLCHTATKLSNNKILYHMNSMLQCKDRRYSILRRNCEQTAVFCMTGLKGSAIAGQIAKWFDSLKMVAENTEQVVCATTFVAAKKGIINAAERVIAATPGMSAEMIEETTKLAVQNSSKAGAITASVGIGLAVVLESGLQVKRCLKYKNEFTYTKQDLALDSAESWTSTALATGAGVGIALAMGPTWLVLLPSIFATIAIVGGVYIGFRYIRARFHFRDKWYREYKVDPASFYSLRSKKNQIKNEILEQDLNPDLYDDAILNDTERNKLLEKFLILMLVVETIDIDIALFDYNNNGKTIQNATKGRSNLRQLIFGERLHPDRCVNLDLNETELQRRRAKYESLSDKINELDEEITAMRNNRVMPKPKKANTNAKNRKALTYMQQNH